MELIEHVCETEFHSISDTNCKQGGKVLDMDEQVNLNPTSNSFMVSKVTQRFNGALIPTYLYTNDTVRAICVKASLPEPINVSFLNEYDCVLELSTDFDLHRITMNLQQIIQWFGYDVIITCEVVTRDTLHELEQEREESNSSSSLDVTGKKNFETLTASMQHIEQQVERVTQSMVSCLVDHVNQQVGRLELLF